MEHTIIYQHLGRFCLFRKIEMEKQKLAILLAVIGTIGAVGGGSYALDFSNTQTSNTDNSQTTTTTINEGDTIINEIYQEVIEEVDEFVDAVDYEFDEFADFADRSYETYCEEVDPDDPVCDEYWEDP